MAGVLNFPANASERQRYEAADAPFWVGLLAAGGPNLRSVWHLLPSAHYILRRLGYGFATLPAPVHASQNRISRDQMPKSPIAELVEAALARLPKP